MQEFEMMGATVDEAIKNALQEKNLRRDDVEITVIDNGSKGILGFNKRPAKILVRRNFNLQNYVEEFFQNVINIIGLKVDAITKLEDNSLNIELVGEDAKFFIGKHGCVLDSFQQILNFSLRKHANIKVYIDAENYRAKQKEMLERYAIRSARKVARSHIKFVFEPMSSYERLIVHKALQNFPNVITYSEGENQNRHVVIDLEDQNRKYF